jgi:hypothetical protein
MTPDHSKAASVLLALLRADAGVQLDEASMPTGHDAVDQVLRERFMSA